jgi:hypothetical protein
MRYPAITKELRAVGGAVVVSGVPPVGSSQPWPLDADVGEVHGQLNA